MTGFMTLMRWLRGLPFGAWTGTWLLATTLLSGVATMGVLAATGRFGAISGLAVGAGALVGLTSAAAAAVAGHRVAATIDGLRAGAMRRLNEPSSSAPALAGASLAVHAHPELAELARAFDALHVRIRVADDVAERHRAMAATASAGMSELLSGLVAAEESARGQLAAELHDTVAQTLQMVRSQLVGADRPLDARDIAHITELIVDAEDQLRGVMARTRPPALRDGDLAVAVLALRDDMRARYGLIVEVDWPTVPHPLPLATAITLYRFFQEALLNVVKHAEVDLAFLRLEVDEAGIQAQVRDKGPGFDPAAVKPSRGRHVGLGLLRERARLAGGTLEVESAVGSGTTLSLWLPRGPGLPSPSAAAR
jgi:signal transduction histidine kinase